ncbi:hypothetical protein NUSPORA_00798 [Nucleospora cyclopteri]
MELTASVCTEKKCFKSTEEINGQVIIKTKIPIKIDKFFIRLQKRNKISVDFKDFKELQNFTSDRKIYENDFLFRDVTQISSGEHFFPFKLFLRLQDNAATKVKGSFTDCDINLESTYTLSVLINDHIYYSYPLNIYDEIDNVIYTDVVISQNTMLRLIKKIPFRIEIDRNWYYSGEKITAKIHSFGKKNIKKAVFNLYEILMINYENQMIRTRRVAFQNASTINQKEFFCQMQIPTVTAGTCKGTDFQVHIILEAEIFLKTSNPIKIKKNINVRQLEIVIPEIEEYFILQGVEHRKELFYVK